MLTSYIWTALSRRIYDASGHTYTIQIRGPMGRCHVYKQLFLPSNTVLCPPHKHWMALQLRAKPPQSYLLCYGPFHLYLLVIVKQETAIIPTLTDPLPTLARVHTLRPLALYCELKDDGTWMSHHISDLMLFRPSSRGRSDPPCEGQTLGMGLLLTRLCVFGWWLQKRSENKG